MKRVETIPLTDIERIAIIPNPKRLTLEQAMKAQPIAPDIGVNGGYYNGNWTPAAHLKADGKLLAVESYGDWGYGWNEGADMRMVSVPPGGATDYRNHITCKALLTPWDGIDAPLTVGKELKGERGWTAFALDGKHLIVWATGDGADAMTLPKLRDELYRMGAETALALDGGQSVKLRTKGGGVYITNPTRPVVQNYIFIWLKKKEEDKPVDKKTVCVDQGHGPGCGNGAPDGSYKEDAFAWDMGQRVRPHLERCGVNVVMTRDEQGYPELTERAAVSNRAGADLLVSLHTNAEAAPGWGTASGLLIYTSAAGDTAGRNKAAKAVLARMREAGVALKGSGLLHEGYTVLVTAAAPAILIEYGFHTNKGDVALLKSDAHRAALALATAKGICDYLGVAWVDEPAKEPEGPTETPTDGATCPHCGGQLKIEKG